MHTLCGVLAAVLLLSIPALGTRVDLHAREQEYETLGGLTEASASSGLQAYSTTYSFSFWSYTPVTATDTTIFDSSMVTTTTVITVYASDQFHALQSLLTAGQSVLENASSSAAQATQSPTLPASTAATTTTSSASTSTSSTPATTSTLVTSTTTSTTASTASTAASTQTQQGGALASAIGYLHRGVVLAIAGLITNV